MRAFIPGLILSLFVANNLKAQSAGDYRSIASGTWATIGIWQQFDGVTWLAAGAAPTSANGVITIQSPHIVNIAATLTVDQVIVNTGATLRWTLGTLTINNGTGTDLVVNGTIEDSRGATPAIAFSAGATWSLGANATILRTKSNSSNNWQNAYEAGIVNIPSTSNWIIRHTAAAAADDVAITTTSGYYGNLFIESSVGTFWGCLTASVFNGATTPPVIKGNLDVGGSGAFPVLFSTQNTNATAILVQGNLIVRSGCVLSINGTGFNVKGNVTVDGGMDYGGSGTRKLELSGSALQTIGGNGNIRIHRLDINNASGVLLNKYVALDNSLQLISGTISTTNTNALVGGPNLTVTGANNTSFVNGPIVFSGSNAITLPVGKSGAYRYIGVTAGSTNASFWTENFGTVCSQGNAATSYVGTNGAWTMTSAAGGNGSNPNNFFVGATEAGMPVGNCGDGCLSNGALTDRTLHVGSGPVAFICPTGDCGAAYFASGTANTDRRVESPTINCSGKGLVQVSFKYIENGNGARDNASLWYFNGTTWSHLADMPKTATGCFGQGIWTSFTAQLPYSAVNNASVKIGFRWTNYGTSGATDPSFAVDDIQLTELETFRAEYFPVDGVTTFGSAKEISLVALNTTEHWILDRLSSTGTRQVILSWESGNAVVTSLSGVRVARFDGIQWKNEGNTNTTGTLSSGSVTSVNVSSYSPFILATEDAVVLPVTMSSFDAWWNGESVELQWVTQSEENTSRFDVTRMIAVEKSSIVATVNAAGLSTAQIVYKAYDRNASAGMQYYRVVTVDNDDTRSYSDWRSVLVPGSTSSSTLTMLTQDRLIKWMCSDEVNGTLRVYNGTGQIVYNHVISNERTISLDTNGWSAGIYLAEVNGEVFRFSLN